MEKTKTDPRIIKSKRAIRNAFAKLLSEKDINDITICEIAKLAHVNRKTFYNYYSGIYQVLDEIENEIIRDFDKLLDSSDFDVIIRNPYIFFEKLTSIISRDIDFYGYLLSMRGNLSLVAKVVILLKDKTKTALQKQIKIDDYKLDILLDYAITGMMSVYQSWFLSEKRKPIEAISKAVSLMCFGGINAVINADKELDQHTVLQ